MIIDGHVHVCGPPFTQDYIQCQTADGSFATLPFRRIDCSVEHLLQAMDAYNIDLALVNAFTRVITNEHYLLTSLFKLMNKDGQMMKFLTIILVNLVFLIKKERMYQWMKFIRNPLWAPYIFTYTYGEALIKRKFGEKPSP